MLRRLVQGIDAGLISQVDYLAGRGGDERLDRRSEVKEQRVTPQPT
jgi:hypothetical protein